MNTLQIQSWQLISPKAPFLQARKGSYTRATFWRLAVVAAGAIVASGVAIAEEPRDSRPAMATLSLVNGDFVEGTLDDLNRPDALRWQCPRFAAPWDFDLQVIGSAHFPSRGDRVKPRGDYCFELHGGDCLFGSLVAIRANEVEVQSNRFGSLHIKRTRIDQISRWRDGEELVYMGPNGLAEWRNATPENAWRQAARCVATDKDNARIVADLHIPPQASIELTLSWQSNAAFVVVLGSAGQDDQRALRLERANGVLTCVWEGDEEADLAVLQRTPGVAGRCHFVIYLDQLHHRATIFSAEGDRLADLALPNAKRKPASQIGMLNRCGGLRLEQLIVRKFGGELPRQQGDSRSHLVRLDGSIVPGDVEEFDAKAKEFVVAAKDGEKVHKTRVSAATIARITWAGSNDVLPHGIHLSLQDGVHLSGTLRHVKGGRLWLECPGIAEPLSANVADIEGLSISHHGEPAADNSECIGRLEMKGVRLHGCLADGAETSHPGCLAWRPRDCAAASALLPDASGVIVYRDPPPPQPSPGVPHARSRVMRRQQVAAPGVNWLNVLAGVRIKPETGEAIPSAGEAPAKTQGTLHLVAGDAIPCKIQRIDDRGVWFESSKYQATFAPHKSIKAIDLENASIDTKIDPTKRDRMLTLPRMRRDDPPRHLIRSVEGDYLLANVVAMDDHTLNVEVRLEERHLPRGKIARIIWLHEGDAAKKAAEQRLPSAMLVQALRRDGNRVTVKFERLDGVTLLGNNETLGQCRVELAIVDQIFFGTLPTATAEKLPYQRWKLHAAQAPKFAQDGEAEGTESALVGKAAPDFELARLDGATFRLSQQRGKIVVLDFWASWCGACVEVLPRITQLTDQFKDLDVLLVAVNLQENPQTIRAALGRLHVNPVVALDESGAIAQKYGASAIPQTVIIDRAGSVSRVFIGGGPQYVENLRESLQKVLDNRDEHPNSK